MPADIRSFFGGKTATPIRKKETKKEEDPKKKRNSMSLFCTADL
jgi:replication factor C subunit 1